MNEDNADDAVPWFKQRYQAQVKHAPTRRVAHMDSIIAGIPGDPELYSKQVEYQNVEMVTIDMPLEQATRLITHLYYFERHADHPAVKQAFDHFMTTVLLTRRY